MILDKKDLDNLVAEGGESCIYDIGNSKIAKIYKPSIDIKSKKSKIEKLISIKLPSCVVKPLELVTDSSGKFIGYTMNFIKGCEEVKRLSNKKFVSSNGINIQNITKLLVEIKNIVKELHSKNIFISDFNDCNVLFDSTMNPYFIDVDSWTFESFKCEVAMEMFCDPLLVGNDFNESTDNYSFAVILFQTLTRLHPFGGTLKQNDIPIKERIKKSISVIGRKSEVIYPIMATDYIFFGGELESDFGNIFNKNKRHLIDKSLDNLFSSLKFCDIHNDYYHSQYSTCPLCNKNAVTVPVKVNAINGIPYRIKFSSDDIQIIMNSDLYYSTTNFYVNRQTGAKIKGKFGCYFPLYKESFLQVEQDNIIYKGKTIPKFHKSLVIISGDNIYYIDKGLALNKANLSDKGNTFNKISTVSSKTFFEVSGEHYFICSMFDGYSILNIDGYNHELMSDQPNNNYGLHYDTISKTWLFMFTDKRGKLFIKIFDKNKEIYSSESFKYTENLSNICYNNSTVYFPCQGKITAFNHVKNITKDFVLDIISPDCFLNFNKSGKIEVISDKIIYEVG